MGHNTNEKSRPILVKFQSQELRDKAWFSKVGLKVSGITMSEFLTKRRYQGFLAARDRVAVSRCWTSGGRIIVLGDDGKRHRISTVADLDRWAHQATDSGPVAGKHKKVGAAKPAAKAPAGKKK